MTRFLSVTQTVIVRQIKKENRAPHVNFIYLRYHGNCLCDPDLVGKTITVKYAINDIRTLRCYRQDGSYLGDIVCPKSWMRSAHTRKTRTLIYQHSRKEMFCGDDPVGAYFSHLLKNPQEKILEIIRVFNETKVDHASGMHAIVQREKDDPAPTNFISLELESDAPVWDIDMVGHGVLIQGDYRVDDANSVVPSTA